MKICFISEANSIHTQRWTAGLAKAGCDIHLVSSTKADIKNVKIHHVPLYNPNPFQQIINNHRVSQIFSEIKPDVFHLFGLFSVSSIGTMFLIRNLDNLLISVWGSDVVSGTHKESLKNKLIKIYLLNKADCIVSISEYLAKEIQKYLYKHIDIETVPWGVDLERFYPSIRQPDNKVIKLGFAKKLYSLSGPDTLLKSFKYASERCKNNLLLKIAGNGPMENQLRYDAKQMGIDDRIEWMGWLDSYNELRNFYDSIDIFLMPSRRESFGVSAAEASASGLPVIASSFGGIPEIVLDRKSGILLEPEDVKGIGEAIILLAENKDLRLKMGLEGKKYVESTYNWDSNVNKMIEIYKKISDK